MSLTLDSLLEHALRNENLHRRYQALELSLIGAPDFAGFLAVLRDELPAVLAPRETLLVVADPDGDIATILGLDETLPPGLVLLRDAGALEQVFPAGCRDPLLGRIGHEVQIGLPWQGPVLSAAVLPLVRQNSLLGLLAIGCHDAAHYEPGQGTDFLERFAAIVTLCLENVLNRERLKWLGLTDPLTGLYNRRYFEQRLQEEAQRTRRHGDPLACLMLDADHFKRINDTWGHQAGDVVLKVLAGRVRQQLRGCDVAARIGGEEFAVLLPATPVRHVQLVAERIRLAIAGEPVHVSPDCVLQVSVSLGAAMLAPGAADISPERLMARADAALYQAKRNGRNRTMLAAAGVPA